LTGIRKVVGWDDQGGTNKPTTNKKTQVTGREGFQQVSDKLQESWLAEIHPPHAGMDTNRHATSFNKNK